MKSEQTRRAFLVRTATVIVGSVALAACQTVPGVSGPATAAPSTIGQPKSLKVGFPGEGPENTPFYIAAAKGYLAGEGLAVERVLLSSGPETQAALTGGSLDLTNGAISTYLRARQQGIADTGIFASAQGNQQSLAITGAWAQAHGISATATADQVAAGLKGARIGVPAIGGAGDVVLRVFLGQHGLQPDSDVSVQPLGGGGGVMTAAMQANRVDAFLSIPPDPQLAAGDRAVVWSLDQAPKIHGMLSSLYFTTQSYVDANGPVLNALARALVRAWADLKSNTAEAFTIYQAAVGPGDPTVQKAGFDANVPFLLPGPVPTTQSYAQALKVYNLSVQSPLNLSFEQALNLTFVIAANK